MCCLPNFALASKDCLGSSSMGETIWSRSEASREHEGMVPDSSPSYSSSSYVIFGLFIATTRANTSSLSWVGWSFSGCLFFFRPDFFLWPSLEILSGSPKRSLAEMFDLKPRFGFVGSSSMYVVLFLTWRSYFLIRVGGSTGLTMSLSSLLSTWSPATQQQASIWFPIFYQ